MSASPTKPSRIRARTAAWAGRPGGPCAQCGEEFQHLQIDHIVPFFDGGRHHLSNIQWLCKLCHQKKSADEVRRHRIENGHLYERPPMSEERRKQVSAFFHGKTQPPELVARRAEAVQRAWAKKSPEERQAIFQKSADKQRGRKVGPMPDERKKKIGEAQARRWASGTRKPNVPKSVGP